MSETDTKHIATCHQRDQEAPSLELLSQANAANAFWSIPLDDESRRMTAFQTHEGIFAWNRLTMGIRLASMVRQSAYYRAMDMYLPAKWRHRFADTLGELFELLKALIECFDKAGILVKSTLANWSLAWVKLISFHNYTISKEQTRPKDENLFIYATYPLQGAWQNY